MDHKFEMVLWAPVPITDPRQFIVDTFGELKDGKLGDFKGCSLFGATREKDSQRNLRVFFQVDDTETIVTSAWLKSFLEDWLEAVRPELKLQELLPFGIERTPHGVRNAAKTVDRILTNVGASLVKEPIIREHKPITITKRRPA